MAQKTYGTTGDPEIDVDVHSAHSNSENAALLGSDSTAGKPLKEGSGSLHSSVGNLANTIIGSGECP